MKNHTYFHPLMKICMIMARKLEIYFAYKRKEDVFIEIPKNSKK